MGKVEKEEEEEKKRILLLRPWHSKQLERMFGGAADFLEVSLPPLLFSSSGPNEPTSLCAKRAAQIFVHVCCGNSNNLIMLSVQRENVRTAKGRDETISCLLVRCQSGRDCSWLETFILYFKCLSLPVLVCSIPVVHLLSNLRPGEGEKWVIRFRLFTQQPFGREEKKQK